MELENRLTSAAKELRQVAAQASPPRFEVPGEAMRPWLAFAAAFAVVLAVVGIPLILSNLGPGQPSDGGPLATAGTTTSVTEPTSEPEPACAASDIGPATTMAYSDNADGSDERDLTEPVADMVFRIATAARECDYETISSLAADDFITSFGGGGVEYIEELAAGGEEIYTIIAEVLNMSHDIVEMPDGSRLYVWPAAFAYDRWEDIPDHLVAELLRIYTQDELDQIALFGSYAGWRAGITESGEWIFFVAGD